MADRWFRVPNDQQTVDSTYSEDGPKYRDLSGVDGHAGNQIDNSPIWVVRIYGTSATLDDIAAKSDTTELTDSEAADLFANASVDHLPDSGWDATSVNERFQVSQ